MNQQEILRQTMFWFGSARNDRIMGLASLAIFIALMALYLTAKHFWPQIERGLETAVRWFWAAGAAPVVGISTRSVNEIFKHYGTKRAKKGGGLIEKARTTSRDA